MPIEGIPLPDFVRRYAGRSADDLQSAMGNGFLLLGVEREEADPETSLFQTVAGGGEGNRIENELAKTTVYPLRAPGTERFMVTIGRTQRSDIFLASKRVSKFHAFLRFHEVDGFGLADAGSTNGTFVENRRIEPKTNIPLHGGEHLSFGHGFAGFFYDARGLSGYITAIRPML